LSRNAPCSSAAHDTNKFVSRPHRLASEHPHPYRFTFADQLISAGISIPSNIAEGSRRPTKAYLNHLSFSLGSHGEVGTLFELIRRRKLVPAPVLSKGVVLIEPIGKMLHGLVESLEARLNAEHV
jgi:four helix bundle protein